MYYYITLHWPILFFGINGFYHLNMDAKRIRNCIRWDKDAWEMENGSDGGREIGEETRVNNKIVMHYKHQIQHEFTNFICTWSWHGIILCFCTIYSIWLNVTMLACATDIIQIYLYTQIILLFIFTSPHSKFNQCEQFFATIRVQSFECDIFFLVGVGS